MVACQMFIVMNFLHMIFLSLTETGNDLNDIPAAAF